MICKQAMHNSVYLLHQNIDKILRHFICHSSVVYQFYHLLVYTDRRGGPVDRAFISSNPGRTKPKFVKTNYDSTIVKRWKQKRMSWVRGDDVPRLVGVTE